MHNDTDNNITSTFLSTGENEAIPVTGRGALWGCEWSRLPHFLGNRLTDGGKVVSLTRRPPFAPEEDSWYSFLLEAESIPGLGLGLGKLKTIQSHRDSNPRSSGL
jgi:hypothetical protein